MNQSVSHRERGGGWAVWTEEEACGGGGVGVQNPVLALLLERHPDLLSKSTSELERELDAKFVRTLKKKGEDQTTHTPAQPARQAEVLMVRSDGGG